MPAMKIEVNPNNVKYFYMQETVNTIALMVNSDINHTRNFYNSAINQIKQHTVVSIAQKEVLNFKHSFYKTMVLHQTSTFFQLPLVQTYAGCT